MVIQRGGVKHIITYETIQNKIISISNFAYRANRIYPVVGSLIKMQYLNHTTRTTTMFLSLQTKQEKKSLRNRSYLLKGIVVVDG